MIKYTNIKGYLNRGEIYPFAHYYQFMQEGAETPITILVHAYECEPRAFKGYLFNTTKTFKSIPMTNEESDAIEQATGKLTQVDFDEIVKGSEFEEAYANYSKIN